jgi:hypothetical protein
MASSLGHEETVHNHHRPKAESVVRVKLLAHLAQTEPPS